MTSRRLRSLVAIVGASVVLGACTSNHEAPVSAPLRIEAHAETCAPPRCHLITPRVRLRWSGASADRGVEILREGFLLHRVPAGTTTFVDADVEVGVEYEYQVRREGSTADNELSAIATTRVPFPPDATAQLRSGYRVALTTVAVNGLTSAGGISNPSRGDRTTELWSFTPACPPDAGPCPTRIEGRNPSVSPHGVLYSGTTSGPIGTCGSSKVRSSATYRLETEGGVVYGGVWTVKRFTGTYTLTLPCASGVGRATFAVVGVFSSGGT